MKAFEDEISVLLKIVQFFFEGPENIVGKGENAGYQHFFFFFLAMFSKAFSSRVIENQESFGKGLQKDLECKESELYKFFYFKGR